MLKNWKKAIAILALMLTMVLGNAVGVGASAENPYEGMEVDPAKRPKQVVYIDSLGELLSYTYDVYGDEKVFYDYYKLYNEYTLILTKDLDVHTDTSWHEYAYQSDWETYGWPALALYANLEGAGHTIRNLWAKPDKMSQGPGGNIGLFYLISNNFIRNLNLEYDSSKMAQAPTKTDIDRNELCGYYGGVTVQAISVSISNVHVKADFHMTGSCGGIAYWPVDSIIEHCSFEGDLSGAGAGGIGGYTPDTSIKNCFFKGTITVIGGGGIADNPIGIDNIVEYKNNVAIVTAIRELDIGIYADHFRPWGSMFGNVIELNMSNMRVRDNYVLNVEGYPQATMVLGENFQIGKETFPVTYTEAEVKGYDDISAFSNKNNFSGLDFEKHWYMDEELGEPRLKRNVVSIIDLTEEKWKDNFKVETEARYYAADDTEAFVRGRIQDETNCQLQYLKLDGADMFGKIALNSLPLFTDRTHVLVVKAGGLESVKFDSSKGIEKVIVNGKELAAEDGMYRFSYRKGEKVMLEIQTAEGYEIAELLSGEGYVVKESEKGYELTFSGESEIFTPAIEMKVTAKKIDGGDDATEPNKNRTWIVVGLSVCGAAIIAAVTVVIVAGNKKKKI